MGFRERPAVSEQDGRASVRRRAALPVSIGHAADVHDGLVEVFFSDLRLGLVEVVLQDLHVALRAFDARDLHRAQLEHRDEIVLGDIAVDELHERLNRLLDAVEAIGLDRVDGVQQRQDRLEHALARVVEAVLDDGHAPVGVRHVLDDLALDHLQVALGGENVVDDALGRALSSEPHAHQRAVAVVRGIGHVCASGVERVDLERRPAVLHVALGIGLAHAVADARDAHPLEEVSVGARLVFGEHERVQLVDLLQSGLIALLARAVVGRAAVVAARVLQRLGELVADFESHDFLGVVLDHLVVDFGSHVLDALKNGLVALVIAPQVIDGAVVRGILCLGIGQRRHDVLRRDFRVIEFYADAPQEGALKRLAVSRAFGHAGSFRTRFFRGRRAANRGKGGKILVTRKKGRKNASARRWRCSVASPTRIMPSHSTYVNRYKN